MATRDRTSLFIQYRSSFHGNKPGSGSLRAAAMGGGGGGGAGSGGMGFKEVSLNANAGGPRGGGGGGAGGGGSMGGIRGSQEDEEGLLKGTGDDFAIEMSKHPPRW